MAEPGGVGTGNAGCVRRDLGELVIMLLAMGVENTAGASSKPKVRQQLMQFGQCGDRCARSAQSHSGTGGSVEHPGGHDGDYTRAELDVNHFTCRPLLAVLPAKSATIERVPVVDNFNLLPDMGRMTP